MAKEMKITSEDEFFRPENGKRNSLNKFKPLIDGASIVLDTFFYIKRNPIRMRSEAEYAGNSCLAIYFWQFRGR